MHNLPMKGLLSALLIFLLSNTVFSKGHEVDAQSGIKRLLMSFDTDGDKKITVLDKIGSEKEFIVNSELKVKGTYELSNLLQELKLLTEDGIKPDVLKSEKVFENPVDRISRLIRDYYWEGLTRRIDKELLSQVMPDSKLVQTQKNILYIPENDEVAKKYYRSDKNIQLKFIPQNYDLTFLKSLINQHGLLGLKLEEQEGKIRGVPYVVPGGRFNEMYGWDSYFQLLGLLQDGKVELAKGLVDNFVYEINHYGKILNANRSYYLSRSQPPFLSSMIRATYTKLSPDKTWLKNSLLAAIKEYKEVWMGSDHLTEMGLSRYFGEGVQIPPEVEPGHFDFILKTFAKKHHQSLQTFQSNYNLGKVQEPKLKEFFIHDQAVRESGHDTTYRWRIKHNDVCADFVTVDLNSLLYKTELDIARILSQEFAGELNEFKARDFLKLAEKRKKLMREYLWEDGKGFSDYNYKLKKRSHYMSATNFYPLWAHDPSFPETMLVSQKEINEMIQKFLPELEVSGGIVSTSLSSVQKVGGIIHERQWDYPYGWAPHQMLLWQGLMQNSKTNTAHRLIYKWLYMITKNAMDYNGTIPEKYDVVERSHAVFAEYGNVGTKFSYITREGFGWMNASYQIGLSILPKELVEKLKQMVPPEKLVF